MKRFCSVVIGYRNTKDGREYNRCGKKATYLVENSDWYVCDGCVAYANNEGWKLKKLKGV